MPVPSSPKRCGRGRLLLAHPDLELVVAAAAWNETEHEMRKRTVHLVAHGHLEEAAATHLLDDVPAMLLARIALVPRRCTPISWNRHAGGSRAIRLTRRQLPSRWPLTAASGPATTTSLGVA